MPANQPVVKAPPTAIPETEEAKDIADLREVVIQLQKDVGKGDENNAALEGKDEAQLVKDLQAQVDQLQNEKAAQKAPPAEPIKKEQPATRPAEQKQIAIHLQTALLIVCALVFHIIAANSAWWEFKDSLTGKTVEMYLWSLKVSGLTDNVSWDKYCSPVTLPECDSGKRTTVVALLFLGIFLAILSIAVFVLTQVMRSSATPSKTMTIAGLVPLLLSIIFTLASALSSTWYRNNTRLDTAGFGFLFLWISVFIMVVASVLASAGVCCRRPDADAEASSV